MGVSKVVSSTTGITSTYVHTGVNASKGPAISPINITYSVGIVENFNQPSDYTEFAYSVGANGFLGFGYSSWFGIDTKSYIFSVSTGPGISGGVDYYWDVAK